MKMAKERWFRFGIGIIMLLVIIWLLHTDRFIFTPFIIFVNTLFIPFLLAGILFYLTRPLVVLLERIHFPRKIAILVIFLLIAGILATAINLLVPIIQVQFNRLVSNIPAMTDTIEETIANGIAYWKANQNSIPDFVVNAVNNAGSQLQGIFSSAGSSVGDFIGGIFDFVFSIVVVPFVLFYLLNDHEKLSPNIVRFFPKAQRGEIRSVLADMDNALASYIQGQLIVSTCVGVVLLIGYFIIGLHYALLLALFGMVMTVVPFLGAIISVIPAVIAAFFQDPIMVIYVIIVMIAAHQIESNFISPQVMGRQLHVHPLTIILLILVGGNLAGLVGLLLIIPTYAVSKVIVQHMYKLFLIKRRQNQQNASE